MIKKEIMKHIFITIHQYDFGFNYEFSTILKNVLREVFIR